MTGHDLAADNIDRLTKLLGLLGSDQDGDGLLPVRWRRSCSQRAALCGADVLKTPQPYYVDEREEEKLSKLAVIFTNREALSDWDIDFALSVAGFHWLSEKQSAIFDQIAEKARAFARRCAA
jgi:hypothetical protein